MEAMLEALSGLSFSIIGSGPGLVNYSLVPVWELDVVFFLFALLSLLHALKHGKLGLWTSGLLGGLAIETACIRGGGTHCHHSGLINVSPCSSGNSVLFYGPWVYCAVMGARRMGSDGIVSQAMWTGLLTGLICWPYEMQGPLARLWKWPSSDGLLMSAPAMGDFIGLTYDPVQGYSTHPAVLQDLLTKLFEFPIHAPFFDMAYGVGIGASLAALPSLPALLHTVFLGPALAVLYIRATIVLASFLDVSVLVVDPCVMAVTAVLALSTTYSGLRPSDWRLAAGPLLSQVYWGSMPWRGLAPHSNELKAVILSITVCGLWIWRLVGTSADMGSAYFDKSTSSAARKKTN